VPKDIRPVQWLGQQALVALPERIDVSNAGQIRDELLAVINHGAGALIADLTATTFCDHAGADAVARAYQRAAAIRTQLRLVVTSGAVLQMLGMSGAGRLVPVYPSVPAALAVLWPAANPRPDRAVLISARLDDVGQGAGAAVTLSLARAQPRNPRNPREPASAVSASLLWRMIDAVSDGVALADGGGTLVLANQRLEEMFGYRPGELTGQPVERLIPADLQASHRGHQVAYARAPSVRPMGSGAALTGLRKDGSTFAAEVSLSPLLTARGRFALAVVRDMTTAGPPVRRSAELLGAVVTALYGIGLDQPADTIGDHDGSHGSQRR
jgi:anti-anti-sigma factor